MKKIALLLLLAASFSMPAFAADGAEPIKLISYNLRTSHGKDGDNVWMKRRHATPEMIRREAPDVFGVQEGLIDQLHYIDTECPQYARVGVGRDDGAEKGEFMAVYYLRDRFELLDSGTFWLSETPDKVSRGWDGACNRTVTWVELKDRKSGKEFFYFNTHLDHKGKGATMLIFGAVLMTVCHLIFAFVLPAYPSTLVAYGAIIILGIGVILIFAASPRYIQFAALGGAGIGFIAIFLAAESYRLERLAIWREPEKYEKGFQTIQGLYAIGSGGLFGRGIGNSIQKLGFVPEAQNDMIFSIICEEMGLTGAIILILIFALLLWRLCVISMNCQELSGAMIAAGIMGHLAIQVILNIAVVTNTIPNTGITLPFISYGGTSIVFLLGEMGLALNVSRQKNNPPTR